MRRYNNYVIFLLASLSFLFSSCASTSVQTDADTLQSQPARPASLNKYQGPKLSVAVLPLGLSERAASRYPHLLQKSVGIGVHNMLLEALFDTNRFTFVETNPEMLKDIMNRQWMSSAGFVSQKDAIEYGKMLGAKKIIYGEVYDYLEGGEQVTGFTGRQNFMVTVGVQIACTDIETGEKIALGTARAVAENYGKAAEQAIAGAVYKLILRMEK